MRFPTNTSLYISGKKAPPEKSRTKRVSLPSHATGNSLVSAVGHLSSQTGSNQEHSVDVSPTALPPENFM